MSEEQKRASRENGKLSRGPTTESGRKRSSRDALRHGLFARSLVTDNERQRNFTTMVDTIAVSLWHLRRAWAIENRPRRHPQFSRVLQLPPGRTLPRFSEGRFAP